MASQNSKKNRSGNPAKAVSSARTWGGGQAKNRFELELPSGEVVRVKRVGLPGLLASGVFPDSIMTIVSSFMDEARGGPKVDPQEQEAALVKEMIDSEGGMGKIVEMLSAFDRIVEEIVVEPKVRRPVMIEHHPDGPDTERPLLDGERDEDIVYTDMMTEEDKMFIFNFAVGGSKDIERFREKQDPALASVLDGEDVQVPTE